MDRQIPFLDLSQIPEDLKIRLKEKFSQMLEIGIFSGGEEVIKLEENLRKHLEVPYAIACSNGTDALEIALRVLEIGQDDEVIVPAISWVSTAEAVCMNGAKPVFVDTDQNGLMNLDLLDQKVSFRTKAIIPVHLYGKMVDMEKLMRWAEKRKVKVIEDAAQAFGAFQNNISAGNWGNIGCFSFYPTKNLGALGEAGALVTKDDMLNAKIKQFMNHGQTKRDEHHSIGKNAKIDSLQAGFLNVKMEYFTSWQKKRKSLSSVYLENLKNIDGLLLPWDINESNHNAHLFVIQTNKRNELKSFLEYSEIGTSIHYPSIIPNLHPYIDGYGYQCAEKLSKQILSLPLNPWMSEEDVLFVSSAVKRFFK